MVWCKIFEYHKMRAVRSMISQKFDGGDASENCDFQRGKQRLQGTKFSNITKWHYFLDELNLKLKNKTCQEISKITKWHYVVDELNLKFKNKHVTIIFDSTSFGTLGKNWFVKFHEF